MIEIKMAERFLDERRAAARITCALNQIPAPGQYLLAYDPASDSPLVAPVFSAGSLADGFLAAPPMPAAWTPGLSLAARGPRGRGFHLPTSARRVLLAAQNASASLVLSLLEPALAQGASVVLACDAPPQDLPEPVEIHPWRALDDLVHWADFLALAAPRQSLPVLLASGAGNPLKAARDAQVLIIAPMPCGGLGQCGVCSIEVGRGGVKLACEDGPVFALEDLFS